MNSLYYFLLKMNMTKIIFTKNCPECLKCCFPCYSENEYEAELSKFNFSSHEFNYEVLETKYTKEKRTGNTQLSLFHIESNLPRSFMNTFIINSKKGPFLLNIYLADRVPVIVKDLIVTLKKGLLHEKETSRPKQQNSDLLSGNQNCPIRINLRSETEITSPVPKAGETPESGFAVGSRQKRATSQTGNTAFVEFLFPPQCQNVGELNEANVRAGSSLHLGLVTVPAVQRVAERESCPAQPAKNSRIVGALCSATADVAVKLRPTGDGKLNSCCDRQETWITRLARSESSFCSSKVFPLKSDYCESERIAHLDYDNEDYVCLGYMPTPNEQLISDSVKTNQCCDCLDRYCVCSIELPQNMATCDDDPRLINKTTRTPGRNISKLKRFFDSREKDVPDSDNKNQTSNNVENKATCSATSSKDNIINEQQKKVVKSNSATKNGSEIEQSNSDLNNPENNFPESLQIHDRTSPVLTSTPNANSIENETNNDKYQLWNSTTNVPYCRKVSTGDLWRNVDTGVKSENEGFWSISQNRDSSSVDSKYDRLGSNQVSNSFVASTEELNNLIAVSRAELSKKKEPLVSDKSTLENYFTSAFESSNSKKFVPCNSSINSGSISQSSDFQNTNEEIFHSQTVNCFDCDVDEMSFDDEEATLSDTSSEEELRCHPSSTNTHYLPAYALHTIIEESCEESERDSRGATPTNDTSTSKLERYFSWDIINDSERDLRRKDDDESTIYSDSLSEGSGSLNGDGTKEIDPSQLASSRLEKYFTSGLVGNDNYFYPDDAEFLDDAPVSDFDEDSIHQKISRSALLSSLETKPISECQTNSSENKKISKVDESLCTSSKLEKNNETVSYESHVVTEVACIETAVENSKVGDDLPNFTDSSCNLEVQNGKDNFINECSKDANSLPEIKEEKDIVIEKNHTCEIETVVESSDNTNTSELITESEVHNITPVIGNGPNVPKQAVNKEQLAIDAQAIIKKLLLYFTDTTSETFKENTETDYISAWQILETEIERLMQSISPTASMENNSCNSSTIDSNNSDYGSDTIESIDCMTDDDDNADTKTRINTKYPLANFLSSAYKVQSEQDLLNFNISDETLSIWKRLIQSLQKDTFFMCENKMYDPSTEARLYITDQIVTLMHTVTVNENNTSLKENTFENSEALNLEKRISPLIDENSVPLCINEAYNVNIDTSNVSSQYSDKGDLEKFVATVKFESSDEGISTDSNENLNYISEPSNVNSNSEALREKIISIDNSQKDLHNKYEVGNNSNINYDDINEPKQISVLNFETKECEYSCAVDAEKLVLDEIDLKFGDTDNKSNGKDKGMNFSVMVDIELGDEITTITERKLSDESIEHNELRVEEKTKRSSLHLWVSEDSSSSPISIPMEAQDVSSPFDPNSSCDYVFEPPCVSSEPDSSQLHLPKETQNHDRSCRDTGYYSFKSSDDSLLNSSTPPEEFVDPPNFKSLKRSVKKFPMSNTLSKSTNNIHQTFSAPDAKFSTLQLKSQKSKVCMNPSSSPSRPFTSLFSPSAVFKRLTGSKTGNDVQNADSSIPSKYLKKYARSSSVENESMLGAISMPHLSFPKAGDSYSAIGLYSENDRDSSLTYDEEMDGKPYSQSVLSLGAHSASMTSVYSAAGCHYGYVTVSGDVLFGLNYNQKSQMMEVFVKQCRNLAAVDVRRNKSDPYVKVYLLPDKSKSGKRKTKTKKNTLNPIFNELLRFPVLKHELESRTLWLSVWNSDLFGRNDFLGEITLPLGYRLLDSPTLRWYPLQERMESLTSPLNYKGELFLALKYVPRDLSLESRFRPAPVISLRGALHVLVKEARNISTNRSGGTLDAFCKSYLLPDKSKSSKQKTPVVKKSRHPKWYYTVIYEDLSIDELKERSLELTVWDHDKITSNEFMGAVRLNTGSGLYHGVSVDWMDSRRDEAALWQAMLQSPNMWVDGCLPLRPTMQFSHS